jgi:hypothetical protein
MSKEKPGPTTEAGKRIASQNAAKHHMTGRVLLLPTEKQSDLDALLAQWQEEYPTETVEAAKLVQEAAYSEWILLRVQRQSDKTLLDLFQKGMDAWLEGDHKRYQLTQRYLTAAERKVERHRRLIWQYRREVRADAREKRAALLFAGRQAAAPDQAAPDQAVKKPEPEAAETKESNMKFTQIAYVSVQNKQTVTKLVPPNEVILRAQSKLPGNTLVKRQIRFEGAQVPDEYAWCRPELDTNPAPLSQKAMLSYHTQRTFALAVEREAASGGHVREWPEFYTDEDQQFIEQELEKECLLNE